MTKREIAEQIRQMKEFGTKMSKKQAVDTLKAAGTILNVEHIDGEKGIPGTAILGRHTRI